MENAFPQVLAIRYMVPDGTKAIVPAWSAPMPMRTAIRRRRLTGSPSVNDADPRDCSRTDRHHQQRHRKHPHHG